MVSVNFVIIMQLLQIVSNLAHVKSLHFFVTKTTDDFFKYIFGYFCDMNYHIYFFNTNKKVIVKGLIFNTMNIPL